MDSEAMGALAAHPLPLLVDLLEAIADGVVLVDAHAKLMHSNAAAQRILRLKVNAGGPHTWHDYYGTYLPDGETPFPVEDYPLMRALRGQATDGVLVLMKRDEESYLLEMSGRPLRLVDGTTGAVAIFRDVTERVQLQTNLEHARDRAADSLLGSQMLIEAMKLVFDIDMKDQN